MERTRERKNRSRSSSATNSVLPKQARKTPVEASDPAFQARIERAKSVFRDDDPYLPRSSLQPTALPTASDWKFRLKVICSENPSDSLVKEAVQGLVNICFPDSFLEELGIHVVRKHMEEEGAPEVNISRMQDVFRREMIHRIAWMLAQHLDSPDKVEIGLASVIAASNKLHGGKLEVETMDDIIAAFQKMRDGLRISSTGDSAIDGSLRLTSSGTIRESVEINGSKMVPIGKQDDSDESERELDVPTIPARKQSVKLQKRKKKKTLTTTRRWDVDPSHLDPDDIPLHFMRKSDLFAYHAYPVVKQDLGSGADDALIMTRIENLFEAMPKDERNKWADSYHKLREGDLGMLKHVSVRKPVDDGRSTPFPPSASTALAQDDTENQLSNAASSAGKRTTSLYSNCTVQVADSAVSEQNNGQDTVKREKLGNTHSYFDDTHQLPDKPQGEDWKDTPIIDLLWGKIPISENSNIFSTRLMTSLGSRVKDPIIKLRNFRGVIVQAQQGETAQKIKSELKNGSFRLARTRYTIEMMLRPWVMTNLKMFPELHIEPFVFTSTVPDTTPIIDSIWPRGPSFRHWNKSDVASLIYKNLRIRGVPMEYVIRDKSVAQHISRILHHRKSDNVLRRANLEEVLRHIAFLHRDRFCELKGTALVMEWERITGLEW